MYPLYIFCNKMIYIESDLPVFGDDGEIERYNVFNIAMLVRHDEDGKYYLYDIMKIKKETSNLFQSNDLIQ